MFFNQPDNMTALLRTFIVLLIFFISQSWQRPLTSKQINQIGEECLKETGMKRDIVVYYRETLKFSKHDKKYMDFLTCSYKKQGYQNAKGEIVFETLAEFLEQFYTKDQVIEVLGNCRNVKGHNAAENAFFVMECIINNLQLIEAKMESDKV